MKSSIRTMKENFKDSINSVDKKYADYQEKNVKRIGDIEASLAKIKDY